MVEIIHRNGNRYRLWYTIPDQYGTPPMTRAEMLEYLMADGATRREASERLARADENGTSVIGATREATAWDTERCNQCAGFHHAYDPREDGTCKDCGEPKRDRQHRRPCAGGR